MATNTKIIIKNSGTESKSPIATDLDVGEIALNYADGKIYYKRGTVVKHISGPMKDVFYENSPTLSSSYTITTNMNALTAGPISLADGVIVTVPDGSTWTVV